jgi:hypothetical protein
MPTTVRILNFLRLHIPLNEDHRHLSATFLPISSYSTLPKVMSPSFMGHKVSRSEMSA